MTLVTLWIASLVATADDGPRPLDAAAPLQGTWDVTSSVDQGQKTTVPTRPGMTCSFRGSTFVMAYGKVAVEREEFVLDPTTTPKRIVKKAPPARGNLPSRDVLGIYEVSGDRLTLAFSTERDGRGDRSAFPTSFDPKAYLVMELTRAKGAPAGSTAESSRKGAMARPTPPPSPSSSPSRPAPKVADGLASYGKGPTPIEGTWRAVDVSDHGRPLPGFAGQTLTITFFGDHYRIGLDGQEVDRGTIRVNAAMSPKWLDRRAQTGADAGKLDLGIYELEGDRLRTSFDKPGKSARPTSFDGKRYEVTEFKRVGP